MTLRLLFVVGTFVGKLTLIRPAISKISENTCIYKKILNWYSYLLYSHPISYLCETRIFVHKLLIVRNNSDKYSSQNTLRFWQFTRMTCFNSYIFSDRAKIHIWNEVEFTGRTTRLPFAGDTWTASTTCRFPMYGECCSLIIQKSDFQCYHYKQLL